MSRKMLLFIRKLLERIVHMFCFHFLSPHLSWTYLSGFCLHRSMKHLCQGHHWPNPGTSLQTSCHLTCCIWHGRSFHYLTSGTMLSWFSSYLSLQRVQFSICLYSLFSCLIWFHQMVLLYIPFVCWWFLSSEL